jgi:hypothetical protein
LSMKILRIWPFFRPSRRPSRSGGPPTTCGTAVWDSVVDPVPNQIES